MNARGHWVVYGLLCVGSLCAGCATYNYHDVIPHLQATGSGQVVVVTHDQRPYVVSGGTDPALIGLLRSGFGIPYPVSTASGRPLEPIPVGLRSGSVTGGQCPIGIGS